MTLRRAAGVIQPADPDGDLTKARVLHSDGKVRTIGDEAFPHNPIVVGMIDSVCNG